MVIGEEDPWLPIKICANNFWKASPAKGNMISTYQVQTNWNLQPRSLSTQETQVRESEGKK